MLNSYDLYYQVLSYNNWYIKILIFIRLHISRIYVSSDEYAPKLTKCYTLSSREVKATNPDHKTKDILIQYCIKSRK